MKSPTKIAIIGCGGIGCNLAPILSRMSDIVLVDGDIYEPANVTRQFPALKHKGNKAMVLQELIQEHTLNKVQSIPAYAQDCTIMNCDEWRGVDFIISGVDNNESRYIIKDIADSIGVPAILAGNEHEHGEAHFVIPEVYDPFAYFEFVSDPHATPWGCNTDVVLDEFPQTILANALAGGAALHLLMSWKRVTNPFNSVCYSRADALSSQFKRVRDLIPREEDA
jgi:molybdopterin/thiamine biosynthesis adenylyltransferase